MRASWRARPRRAFRRGQPHGPLDGIPYSIKDLEPTAGIRTTYGSRFFEHNVPTEDGARRRPGSAPRAGVLLGKTNTPHFGYKDMCDNLIGPPCKNPWNLDAHLGGLLGRRGSGGRGRARAGGPRLRRLRLDPHPLSALRHLRPEALARPGALLAERRPLERALPQRPDDAHRPRRGDPAAGHGGSGSARSRSPSTRRPTTTWPPATATCGAGGLAGASTSGSPRWTPRSPSSPRARRGGSRSWARTSRRRRSTGATPTSSTRSSTRRAWRRGTTTARASARTGSSRP